VLDGVAASIGYLFHPIPENTDDVRKRSADEMRFEKK